ncbi:MAG: diguanylate cyclase [Burkholderiaceae bacterium]
MALALAYAHNHRPEDAEREFLLVRPLLVKNGAAEGTPEVFWTLVEARVAIAAGRPRQAADVALATLAQLNENAVDSPFDLMQLHATVSEACESIGDDRRALSHERRRAVIRERLIRLGAHAASLAHTIRHELESTRAERDRITALHAELEREHARLAALNSALTAQIAENLLLHDALKEQNYRDALTGLPNRRYLYERGPRLLEASFLRGVPLCLAMIDLDHFKRLNDMHGHVVGDRVLVALGKVMREGLRENDIVCRVGGEEFAMILTDSTAAARERLKRMLAACAQLRAAEGEEELPSGLSFSAGIVEAPAHCGTIDALMIAADRLLYKAKHNGRARIEAAGYPIRRVLPRASLAVRETIDR